MRIKECRWLQVNCVLLEDAWWRRVDDQERGMKTAAVAAGGEDGGHVMAP